MKKYVLGLVLILGLFIIPSISKAYTFQYDLNVGSKGQDVTELQKYLISSGYLDSKYVTGTFGKLTLGAVKKWQKANKFSSTSGAFGPKYRALLNKNASLGVASNNCIVVDSPKENDKVGNIIQVNGHVNRCDNWTATIGVAGEMYIKDENGNMLNDPDNASDANLNVENWDGKYPANFLGQIILVKQPQTKFGVLTINNENQSDNFSRDRKIEIRLDLSNVKISTETACTSAAIKLFPSYISRGNDLTDYKVNDITFFAFNDATGTQYFSANDTKNACMVSVNYSVKPTTTAYFNWLAGNGHESSDGWIINKSGFVTLDKNSNGYYIKGMGTGY